MIAYVLQVMEELKMRGCNEINKFNNTGARKLDSIYQMTF